MRARPHFVSPSLVLLFASIALGAAGCADRLTPDQAAAAAANNTGSKSGGSPAGSGAGSNADAAGIPTNSTAVSYAKGWSELDVDANSAKNTVDTAGHFHTDQNMCKKPGDGVFDPATWNALANALNQAALTGTLSTPRCWPRPDDSKFYNHGLAELVNGTTRRKLFENKDGQICTTLSDAVLADSLIAQIDAMLLLDDRADAQECPNYHPGG